MVITYKVRLYPKGEKESWLHKNFGCERKIFNLVLDEDKKMYDEYKAQIKQQIDEEKLKLKKEGKEVKDGEQVTIDFSKITAEPYLSKYDAIKKVREFKEMKEYDYLLDADSNSLQKAATDAYISFKSHVDNKTGCPRYRSKKDAQSYKTDVINNNIRFSDDGKKLKLPKVGYIKCAYCRPLMGPIKMATVERTKTTCEYYACLSVDVNIEAIKLPELDKKIGLDMGVAYFFVTSDGDKKAALNAIEKYEKKLAKLQRQLAKQGIRKEIETRDGKKKIILIKKTKQYCQTQKKIAKLYEKMKNMRLDYLHKLSREIINNNQVIITETLDIIKMEKDPELSKGIADAAWGIFFNMLKYKAEMYGRTYIQIDQFYPSSQLCSKCGYKNEKVKNLKIRSWTCPKCNAKHDRDINAAKNILAEGKRILEETK